MYRLSVQMFLLIDLQSDLSSVAFVTVNKESLFQKFKEKPILLFHFLKLNNVET